MSQQMRSINPKARSRGFTLLEVLVSMAIMTVGLLGVAALIGSTLATGTQARYMNIANVLASEKLDNLNKWPSNDPNVAAGGALAGPANCVAGDAYCDQVVVSELSGANYETQTQVVNNVATTTTIVHTNSGCVDTPVNCGVPAPNGNGAGGGFYINGNASITLAATTGGDGTTNPTQTYTITQGSTTTTIILDNVAGLTTVYSGGTTLSLAGIPQQLDPNTGQAIVHNDPSGNAVNPALLYVNGAITGLNGTVQNNEGITVVASSSVSITGDLTYMQSPVSIPADTLNASTNAGVLGIFTTSNINLYPNSNGNLTVNASLAAIGSGSSGFATPGGSIGTWTIVGGRAEDQAHSVNISTGNTYYDRRFANNFGPPWFPTAVPQPGQAGIPAGPVHMSVTRLSWKEVNR